MTKKPFENESLRKALELSEGPAQRLIRQMKSDAATRAVMEVHNSPVAQAERILGKTDIQRFLSSAVEAHRAFETYKKSQQWAEISGALSQAHSFLEKPETFAAIQRIDHDLKKMVMATSNAIIPLAEQIDSFSITAAQAIQPLQNNFKSISAWQESLVERMGGLKKSWAIEEHLGISIVGFARIARLHDISIGDEPFAPASREVFLEELGEPVAFDGDQSPEDREVAQIDAGMNAEVIAFPRKAYPHVLFSAGFEFRFEAIKPVKTDGGEVGQCDPQHASLLAEIENRLRDVIETELLRVEGTAWLKRRIHGDTRRKWQDRKTADHEQRGDSFPLLYYADFMELMDIICEGKNWKDVFERFFASKQDFQVSMQRLGPVRNTISHNRPLVRTDQLILLSEGTRILRALGVQM